MDIGVDSKADSKVDGTVDGTEVTKSTRKIIHCDCDCFYAAVEMRDDPSLANLPIAIGGKSDRRGVVATCNYKARHFGVHSAMPTGQALKLCPDLVVIPGTMAKYREAALQIRQIFYRYTDKVEPLSLDEAYLDVTDCTECQGSATLIAQQIRAQIATEVGVTASAGVAPNKFLAKVASDLNKPDGQFVITPEEVDRRSQIVKLATYESGMRAVGTRWTRFNFRYYYFALLFVVFDVETIFLYPWAVRYGVLSETFGWVVLAEVLVFLAVVTLGYVYAWRKKALEWV